MKYKNYGDYRAKTQKEFNSLPIFYAFSNEQLKEAMEARGLKETDTDKIYRFGDFGGFYLKSDADIIRDYINKPDELPDLMKDKDFAISAFEYEMKNHEYAINWWQGDFDVCSCFGHCKYGENKGYTDYLKEIGYSDDIIQCYKEARKKYYKYFKYCDERNLF